MQIAGDVDAAPREHGRSVAPFVTGSSTAAAALARLQPPSPGGDVFSWGSGEMGQLGFPLLEDLPRDQDGYPYEPTAGLIKAFRRTRIRQIAGGDGHTAAVTVNGRLYSWGASACGQLGHSDTEHMPKDVEGYPYQPVPLLVESLQDVRIVQIACGDAHTVALSREGLLYSWGGGGCGQLGHSETSRMPKDEDGCPYQPAPRVVEHLRSHVIATLACGKAHTIAVSDRGRMFTWGAGACGQLGHPDTSSFPSDEDGYPFQPVPREVEHLRDWRVVATACGDVHTLALTDEGHVYSFGGGSYGQLGMKDVGAMPVDADNCPYMPTPHRVAGLEAILKLACGDSHSLTADRNGRLYCWGANSCGQLGILNPEDPRIRKDPDGIPHLPTPALVEALMDQRIVDIACGEAHSLAVSASGNMYSWGACSCGQLGHGGCEGMPVDSDGYPYQPAPTIVTAGFQGKAVLKVACGGVHNLAITEPDQSLASSLSTLVNNEMLADACIKSAEGGILPVHLCILWVNAPRLYNFVQSQIEDRTVGKLCLESGREIPMVEMSNVRTEVLVDFIHYVYTMDADSAAQSLSTFAALLELYHLGSKFNLSELLPRCRRMIRQHIGKQNLPRPLPAAAAASASAWGFGGPAGLHKADSGGTGLAMPPEADARGAGLGLPPEDDVPAPMPSAAGGDWPTGDDWGIFFLPGGQALVLDGAAYRETLRRGTMLDLADPEVPTFNDGTSALEDHMRNLMSDSRSSDVRLVVRKPAGGEMEFCAHKCVLACRSAYFRALFSSEFRERSQSRLPLDDVSPDQLVHLLNFIYADEWKVEDQDYAFEMIPIVDRFSVLDLKRLCERTLICTMSVENVARIFALADRYSCGRLRSRALLFMTDPRNFHLVMKTDSFAELDKALIIETLHSHKMAPAPAAAPSEPLPGSSATAAKPGQSKSSRDHRHARGAASGPSGSGTARPQGQGQRQGLGQAESAAASSGAAAASTSASSSSPAAAPPSAVAAQAATAGSAAVVAAPNSGGAGTCSGDAGVAATAATVVGGAGSAPSAGSRGEVPSQGAVNSAACSGGGTSTTAGSAGIACNAAADGAAAGVLGGGCSSGSDSTAGAGAGGCLGTAACLGGRGIAEVLPMQQGTVLGGGGASSSLSVCPGQSVASAGLAAAGANSTCVAGGGSGAATAACGVGAPVAGSADVLATVAASDGGDGVTLSAGAGSGLPPGDGAPSLGG